MRQTELVQRLRATRFETVLERGRRHELSQVEAAEIFPAPNDRSLRRLSTR